MSVRVNLLTCIANLGGPVPGLRFGGSFTVSELQRLLWRRAQVLRMDAHPRGATFKAEDPEGPRGTLSPRQLRRMQAWAEDAAA